MAPEEGSAAQIPHLRDIWQLAVLSSKLTSGDWVWLSSHGTKEGGRMDRGLLWASRAQKMGV